MTASKKKNQRAVISRLQLKLLLLLLLGIAMAGVRVSAFTMPSSSSSSSSVVSSVRTHRQHTASPLLRQLPSLPPMSLSLSPPLVSSSPSTTTTRLGAGPASSLAGLQSSLHSNVGFVLTAILWLSTFGSSLERRSKFGKALSAPLVTMALSLVAANVGILPFHSIVYTVVNRFFVPLAVPLLLFDSDLKRVINDTGTLLVAFGVGALATVVATLVAFPLVPLASVGTDTGWRVACALAARHIGGAINFVAVAETLNIGGDAVAAAIAADNVVVALYFAFLFWIAKAGEEEDASEASDSSSDTAGDGVPEGQENEKPIISELAVEDTQSGSTITLPSLAISLSVASSLVTAGSFLTRSFLPAGTSSLPMISTLTVLAATVFPKFFARLSETGTALGVIFVQMFFACSGAAGSIRMVIEKAPALFAFSAIQIGVHFCTLMAIGRGILRLPKRELYLASNANVGGPTTAAAMAQAKEWPKLVLPALLIGILGYASATALALSLGPILIKMAR
eukprot:jgi/Psemu1/326522/estExt_fgenesh1_pg.C_4050015